MTSSHPLLLQLLREIEEELRAYNIGVSEDSSSSDVGVDVDLEDPEEPDITPTRFQSPSHSPRNELETTELEKNTDSDPLKKRLFRNDLDVNNIIGSLDAKVKTRSTRKKRD